MTIFFYSIVRMKIIVAFDSFKGCLTSLQAGEAAARGVRTICPDADLKVLSLSDGGEGMLDALLAATGGRRITLTAHDPLMRLRQTSYGLSPDGITAFIELASISGLTLLTPDERNPLYTTTYGCGELIYHALDHGCRHIIIGLGGSATNDAGLGLLQALGYRFLDRQGIVLGQSTGMCGADLSQVANIDTTHVHPALAETRFTAACDVRNPFVGINGAAHVFAPQKGATAEVVRQLDDAMRQLADVVFRHTDIDLADREGAGAAGGVSGALLAFLHAELRPGIRLLLDALHFEEEIKDADLILTGEGKSDRQTLMGKLPHGILQSALNVGVPVALLSGSIEDADALMAAGFQSVRSINPAGFSLQEAMQPEVAEQRMKATAADVVSIFQRRF